jgi:hypothetical protein
MKNKQEEWIPCTEFGTPIPLPRPDARRFNKAIDEHLEQNKAQIRKATPIYSGVLAYFPRALAEVSRASLAGNKQHLDGQPLHWDRSKSKDQLDAATRHLIDHAKGIFIDDDNVYHLGKSAWRILAELEIILEQNEKQKQN